MEGLPQAGERFAHYRIIAKLGAGGMGEVYRAHDESLHRDVAIKVLPATNFDDPAARARLVREARAAAALNHPFICTVHEVGEAEGQTYIAMELIEGHTLSSRLAEGTLPPDQVVRYGLQLAEALAHAHDRGVLHRDLKSANVIVTPDGRVKVLDFGLAKRVMAPDHTTQFDASAMEPGHVAGTLAYMAPEQLRGLGAQPGSDVWALGVVLYELAQGVRPFHGQTGFELSAAILGERPAPMSSVPAGLQSLILRCLEKDPGQRYKTGSEVRAALEMVQTRSDVLGEMSETQPVVVVPPARADRRRWLTTRRALWLGLAAAIVAAVTTWQLWPSTVVVRSLAVLPFQNARADESIEHLCDGITEGLIRQLAALPSLRVTGLRRVLGFKAGPGQAIDAQAAGRDLRVDSVLVGTLNREAGRLSVSVELIDVATGRRLWDNKYERDAQDLLNVQDHIASAIMDEGLRVRVSTAERRRLVSHPTTDAEAYDLYLLARNLQRRGEEQEYLQSREFLERAVQRDKNFALAYAALSGLYAMMVTDGLARPTDAWPQVDRYLGQAVEIDPDLVDASAFTHARAFLFSWDWPGAERARKVVMQTASRSLDPDDYRAIAIERWALGRADEALELIRRNRQLDPLNPEFTMLEADYLVHNGKVDDAIALYKESINLEPANPSPYFGLAEALHRQRRFDEANDLRRQAHAIAGDDAIAEAFAKARGEAGYRQTDRLWVEFQLEKLKERSKTKYASPLDFARAYAQLGDKEQTFRYLEAAFNDRSPGLVFLNVDRAWDNVRTDERFLAAVKRMDFPARK